MTPNVREVIETLRHAAEYIPTKQIVGYQNGGTTVERVTIVRDQIKAIFLALEEKEITYINSPISFGQQANDIQQRVSLPKDSLRSRSANCIDGAVLYASLIERAAINPVIVLIPGHAFVGWETWPGSQQYEYLETTMTGSHTFEEAFQVGMQEGRKAELVLDRPMFPQGDYARRLDVKTLRRKEIVPME